MFRQVDTRVPDAVEEEVQSIHLSLFPRPNRPLVPRAFEWVTLCFRGNYDNYQAIDARYHDLEHTMQGTLCLARLLHGRHQQKESPEITPKAFELALLAILFHDTGYLKKRGDVDGTGAKYTPVHVNRSAAFAREFLSRQGYSAEDMDVIETLIRCTGLNVDLSALGFRNEMERVLGSAVGTADLLGQMAAHDYVDKLPVLYQEFEEAARFDKDKHSRAATFTSAQDLKQKTPLFWENYVWPKINNDFGKLYCFLNDPFPDGPNPYLQRIEQNLARLKAQLEAEV